MNMSMQSGVVAVAMSVAAVVIASVSGRAQDKTAPCSPAAVIPLTAPEPAARVVVGAPLAEPLATRGVVVIPYCAVHMRIAPVFGGGALSVSPRIGHVHVRVDGASWVWADASGTPIILQGLTPGRHEVSLELVDANHRPVDRGSVVFEVPAKAAAPY